MNRSSLGVRGLVTTAFVVVGLAVDGAGLDGQGISQLAEICAGDSELRAPWCRAGALAYQAAAGGIGLSATRGTDIPGTASTLGRRLGATPRVALSAMLTATSIPIPGIADATSTPVPAARSFVPGVSVSAAVGVLDGFRLAPGIGGVLSVDAVGDVDFMWPSESDGFSGGGSAVGLGARIGVLRESFTVPGISVSILRRFFSETSLGVAAAPATGNPPPEGGPGAVASAGLGSAFAQEASPASVEFDVVATSVRVLVGKDLLALGVLGGVGWDRYGGNVTLVVEPPAGEGGGASGDDVSMDRWLAFAGASWTYLVIQLNGEIGWALGFDDVPGRGAAPFDPGSGSFFGTLSLRLTI